MVGKSRKRESRKLNVLPAAISNMDDSDILDELSDHLVDHKRLRLDVMDSSDELPSSHLNPSNYDFHGGELAQLPGYKMLPNELDVTDLFHDSGSDCVAMESSSSPLDDDDGGAPGGGAGDACAAATAVVEEEPYIDVVSEDSAIQEELSEELNDADVAPEESHYSHHHHHHHQMSPMHNLISSHDDSAIIKSEIFDPAFDEMNHMLTSGTDYDHAFLNDVDTSDFLRAATDHQFRCCNDTDTASSNMMDSLSQKSSLESLSSPISAFSSSGSAPSTTDTTGICCFNPLSTINSSVAGQAASVSITTSQMSATAPDANNGANNSAVLTTPVYIAQQGAPGPAGQANSIITTHMARLVPSPDGKGYILHLGLNPAAAGAGSNPLAAAASTTSSAAPTANFINSSSASAGTTANIAANSINISATSAVTSQLGAGAGGIPAASLSTLGGLNPASLNITITSATTQNLGGLGSSGLGVGLAGAGSGDVPTPVPIDMNASSSSPLGGSTLETDHEGNFVLKNNASNAAGGTCNEIMNVSDPVGTCVDASLLNHKTSAVGSLLPTSLIGSTAGVTCAESLFSAPSLVTDAESKLLDSASEAQLLRLMQPPNSTPRTKSKRRNSRELRELVELEKLSTSTKTGDDLDRFVICSDGPMNCALCGYNTVSYSSFKSHIICSHPCWRITKKLSRNRLLVEKSVKVSIPVANFSVPNPVPAVPIQQRVQSKKGKKEKAAAAADRASSENNNSGGSTTSERGAKEPKEHKHSKHKGSRKNRDKDKSVDVDEPKSSGASSKSHRNGEKTARERRRKKTSSSTTNHNSNNDSSDSSENLSQDMDSSVTLTGRQKQIVERNKRVFRCTKCNRLFVFEGSVANHIMEQHGIAQAKAYDYLEVSNDHGKTFGPMFRCPQGNCCFTSGSAGELDRHKADKHTVLQKVYRCQICGYFADSTKAVQEHAAKIHPKEGMMYGLTD